MFQIQERVRQYFAPVPSPGVCKGNKICEFFQTNLTPIFNAFGLSCNIEGDIKPLVFLITICTTLNVALFYWIYRKWRRFKELEAMRQRNLQVEVEQQLRENRLRLQGQVARALGRAVPEKEEELQPGMRLALELASKQEPESNPIHTIDEATKKSKRLRARTKPKPDNTNVDLNDNSEKLCTDTAKKTRRVKVRNELKPNNTNIDIDDKADVCAKKSKQPQDRAEANPDNANIDLNDNTEVCAKKSNPSKARAEAKHDNANIELKENIEVCAKKSKPLSAQTESKHDNANIDRNHKLDVCANKSKTPSAQAESKHDNVNIEENIEMCAKKSRPLSDQPESKHDNANIDLNENIEVCSKNSKPLRIHAESKHDHLNANVNDNIVLRAKKSKTSKARVNIDHNDNIECANKSHSVRSLEKSASVENIDTLDKPPLVPIFKRRSSLQSESHPFLTKVEVALGYGREAKSKSLLKPPDMTYRHNYSEARVPVEDTEPVSNILNETFGRNGRHSRIPLPKKPSTPLPRK